MQYIKKYQTRSAFETDFTGRQTSASVQLESPAVILCGDEVQFMPYPCTERTYHTYTDFGFTIAGQYDIDDILTAAKGYYTTSENDVVWDYLEMMMKASAKAGGTVTVMVPEKAYVTALISGATDVDSEGGDAGGFDARLYKSADYKMAIKTNVSYSVTVNDTISSIENIALFCLGKIAVYSSYVSMEMAFALYNSFMAVTSSDDGDTVTTADFVMPCDIDGNILARRTYLAQQCRDLYTAFSNAGGDMDMTPLDLTFYPEAVGGYPQSSGLREITFPSAQ